MLKTKILAIFAALALTGCATVGTGSCEPRPDGSKICKLVVDRSHALDQPMFFVIR